jgi:hypothetical protein
VNLSESIHPIVEASGSVKDREWGQPQLSSSVDNMAIIFDAFVFHTFCECRLDSGIIGIHKVIMRSMTVGFSGPSSKTVPR